MNARRLSSITVRTLSRVVGACLVVFLFIGALTYYTEQAERIKSERGESQTAVARSTGALSNALWNYDQTAMVAILKGLTQWGVIVRAEVRDDHGMLIAAGIDMGQAASDRTWQVDIRSPDQQHKIGTLTLYESYSQLRKQLVGILARQVLAELAKVLVLATLLFYIVYKTITRHLVSISRDIDNLLPDDIGREITLPRRPHDPDELDELVAAINSFHRQRVLERQRRQKAEQDARQRLDELARIGRVAVAQSLSASLAHELNQPLGAIISNAQAAELSLASGSIYAPMLREIISDISSEARRAGKIVGNLRGMVEKRNAAMEVLDLNELIVATRELAKWGNSDTRISIDLNLGRELPLVLGNRVQLQQVMLNLVTNAKEALTEAGRGGTVDITTQVDEVGAVSVSVCDNGTGVSAASIRKVFDPFYTTKEGGTGMGLWISYMIVEQHGGKLEVRNIESGGACFCFTLPSAERK